MTTSPQRTVQLVESVVINPEVRHLVFEAAGEAPFDFQPGQHLCLGTELDGRCLERYYSIASAPDGSKRFEVCVKASPHAGRFGRHLAAMKPGDELICRGPAGEFQLKHPVHDAIFVASGTGLAPLRSMVRHLIAGKENLGSGATLTMILGTRDPDWSYYYDEFNELARRTPAFRFWPSISRPTDGWKGRVGYAQAHLQEALAGRTAGVDVYLCGHLAMVHEIRSSLERSGFDSGSIVYEQYG